jgi:hypothetical protein
VPCRRAWHVPPVGPPFLLTPRIVDSSRHSTRRSWRGEFDLGTFAETSLGIDTPPTIPSWVVQHRVPNVGLLSFMRG